jgi:pSer/pThr/pTyr-binding forkhead associated (FHA) protein
MDANRTQMLSADPNRTVMGAAPVADPNKTVMGNMPSLNLTQTIKPVQCPVCKTFNPGGVIFCVECGLIFDRALPDDAFGAPAVQLPFLLDSSGREHPLRPGVTVIGREGDIAFVDGKVSRRHAQIALEDEVAYLEDLGSTNGTKVGDRKLAPGERVALEAGTKISFGGFETVYEIPGGVGGNKTQTFGGNRTAAISATPTVDDAPAKLVGYDQSWPLRMGENTFGRKPENNVAIVDPYVSGRHGIIELTEDSVYVTDTGSTNGTKINDIKLGVNMRTLLGPGDVIRLGSIELRVERRV